MGKWSNLCFSFYPFNHLTLFILVHKVEPFDRAVRFESKARELMLARDHAPLVNYESLGRDATLSAPTPAHYLPLLYVIAQQREGDEVTFPVDGFDGGSISMLTIRIG